MKPQQRRRGIVAARLVFLLLLLLLSAHFGCGTLSEPGGPLTAGRALDRYERILLPREDGSLLECYLSHPFFEEPTPILFLCQGWGYASMFERYPLGNVLDMIEWIWAESRFRNRIRVAFVEKRGVRFGSPELDPEESDLPEEYLVHDTLDSRLADVGLALNEIIRKPCVDPGKIVVWGHGEGALVAAAAARISPHVTHLGYLANGGRPRLEDLASLKRSALKASQDGGGEVEEEMAAFFATVEAILGAPSSTGVFHFGQTPLHLTTFGLHDPLEDLLALEIPLFVALGGEDPHIPMDSADAIRLAFLLAGKTNLTFRIYPGLDHGFRIFESDAPPAEDAFQLPRVFDDFCAWLFGE